MHTVEISRDIIYSTLTLPLTLILTLDLTPTLTLTLTLHVILTLSLTLTMTNTQTEFFIHIPQELRVALHNLTYHHSKIKIVLVG